MIPLLLDFWGAFGLVVLIIVFVMLYRLFYPDIVKSQIVAFVVTAIVTFTLVIPYPWFKYLLFVFLFLYGFFWTFKPYKW